LERALRFLHSDYYVIQSCCVGCATHFVHVRRLEFSFKFNCMSSLSCLLARHQVSIGSRVTSPCRCQVQSIFRVNAISSFHGIQLRTSSRCTKRWYLPVASRLLQLCIQLQTLHVNLFAIYTTLFITFRSSYNVLCCHTMLAGALWGIKCDK
jgi:hypothetical protein